MDDDFNTPEALAVLFELAHETQRARVSDPARAVQFAGLLKYAGDMLGLIQEDPLGFLRGGAGPALDPQRIEALIAARAAAKKNRDYAEADRIRAQLLEEGVVLEDSAQGTSWRRG